MPQKFRWASSARFDRLPCCRITRRPSHDIHPRRFYSARSTGGAPPVAMLVVGEKNLANLGASRPWPAYLAL
jgi:hypothetical protein